MLIRYVRMSFQEKKVDDFLKIFSESKDKIRAMPGCVYLELQQDVDNPTIFMTHSHWLSVVDLNNYRDSALFQEVWTKTKILFSAKPQAFSVEKFDNSIKFKIKDFVSRGTDKQNIMKKITLIFALILFFSQKASAKVFLKENIAIFNKKEVSRSVLDGGKKDKSGRYRKRKGFLWGLFKGKNQCDCPKH